MLKSSALCTPSAHPAPPCSNQLPTLSPPTNPAPPAAPCSKWPPFRCPPLAPSQPPSTGRLLWGGRRTCLLQVRYCAVVLLLLLLCVLLCCSAAVLQACLRLQG